MFSPAVKTSEGVQLAELRIAARAPQTAQMTNPEPKMSFSWYMLPEKILLANANTDSFDMANANSSSILEAKYVLAAVASSPGETVPLTVPKPFAIALYTVP